MRIALTTLTLMGAIAAVAMWLPGEGPDDGLAVVTGVGVGGNAKVAVQANAGQSRSTAKSEVTAADAGAHDTRYRVFGFPVSIFGATGAPAPVVVASAVTPAVPAAKSSPTTPQPTIGAIKPPAPVLARDAGRAEIVREIQRELKRVGCYAGDVDGEWGAGSRRAMRAFIEKVNSTLPSEDPDLIQLLLVRGASNAVCAATCPADRVSPGTGRCLNGPIIATRRPPDAIAAPRQQPVVAAVGAAQTAPSAAVAGPVVRGSVSGLAQAPATVGVGQVGALAAQSPSQSPSQSQVQPVVPLEGRMAIGAPVSSPLAGVQGGVQVGSQVVGSSEPLVSAGLPVTGLGAVAAPPHRAERSVDRPRQARAVQRQPDRSWTKSFFNN